MMVPMSLAEFSVEGPFPLLEGTHNHLFAPKNLRTFWDGVNAASRAPVSDRAGCYVFAIKTPRNLLPWYVGKTFGSLSQEAFAADKERKYLRVLAKYTRATPVWFFVPET